MQDTICRLSLNLEEVRKELHEYKKYSYDFASPASSGTIVAKMEMKHSMSYASSLSKLPDQKSKDVSLHKLGTETPPQPQLNSPNFVSSQHEYNDHHNYLTNNSPLRTHNFTFIGQRLQRGNSDFEIHTLNEEGFFVKEVEEPQENIDLLQYLQASPQVESERKELFKVFSKRYSLDQILHLNSFFSGAAGEAQFLELREEIDFFIRFVVRKLQAEQRNRLKTEE
eukprot:CAMPEP_0202969188 /NCGR_PEP_ID=MMETSP1396-20130829/14820_1 /ASSEMBLY_ACC=CAM_ASM_000872 /TAXON_ID= /ORGANISM="Pseudokeronopsis sp., Strain Brazil" /LENGTH=224 /DNA_ID=CAMNT_0049696427 /DNA_START=1052 /DNA_END=1726 /DNA_ORIENTATION=+